MTIRSILVHLSNDERSATLTDVGLDLAQKHDAKLIALYTSNPWQLPTDVLGYVPPELIDRFAEDVQRAAAVAKDRFDSAVAATTVASEWRHVEGFANDVRVTHSRYADLTIVGQANSDNAAAPQGLPDAVMLSAGRPVLIIPYAGKFSAIGNKILIAWNGTREAARAVSDALPFLKAAKETLVVGVDTIDDQHIAGADPSGIRQPDQHPPRGGDPGAQPPDPHRPDRAARSPLDHPRCLGADPHGGIRQRSLGISR